MEDIDKTIPPQRENVFPAADDVTMPGKRDRKPDGRFAVGDLIMNRYKVLAELGQGGMGVVYKCFDETAGIEVALKALPPELSHNTIEMEDIKDNFQLVHNLHHPNIASSNNLERDNSNGNYYLIMECCEGEDLRRWLKRKRKEADLTLESILPIIQQVADALDYAHRQKIIHRDIKPGNIMINSAGEIKVLDFGLAAQIHTSMTRVSMAYHGTSGTGPYMAPEQWRGRAQGAAADQYALAVMTYEMLAGRLPFESTDAAVLREAVLNDVPEDIANQPSAIRNAIKRAMSKEPAERFESCSDFAAALGGKKIKIAKVQKKGRFPKWAAAVLIAVLLGAVGTGYYFFDKRQKEQARLEQFAREKQQKIATILQLARVTKNKSQWQEVLALTKEILQLDPLNNEAEKLHEEAIRKTKESKNPPSAIVPAVPLPPAIKKPSKQEELRKKSENELARRCDVIMGAIAQKKRLIDSANYDRGQTFGENLDKLARTFNAGVSAHSRKDYEGAIKFFKQAEDAFSWLIKNADLRKNAKECQAKAYLEKQNADSLQADSNANKTYKTAYEQLVEANKQFEQGEFVLSAIGFKNVISAFQKATVESRKKIITELLRQADLARNAKYWQKVYDLSKKVLDIDRSNREAGALMTEADNNLARNLKIAATVNGKIVPAQIKFGNKTFDTLENILTGFKKNKNYKYDIFWQDDTTEYTYSGNIDCTWNKDRTLNIELKKTWQSVIALAPGVDIEMIKVERGSFEMGDKNKVSRQVTLTHDYWIGKYEVTQEQWRAVMNNNAVVQYTGDKLPVDSVSWNDAKKFCEKMNSLFASKLPQGYKFDLPSEAQWEYACRGGSKSLGYQYSGSDNLDDVGWYWENSGNSRLPEGSSNYFNMLKTNNCRTHTVGGKKANELGIYDMSGNVAEWCRDRYAEYDKNDTINPLNTTAVDSRAGILQVLRGGHYIGYSTYCRTINRSRAVPTMYKFKDRLVYTRRNSKNSYTTFSLPGGSIGFRLALVCENENYFIQESETESAPYYDDIREMIVANEETLWQNYLPHELYNKALGLQKQGNIAEAEQFLKLAWKAGYYDKKHYLGQMYEQKKNWKRTFEYYADAIQKNSSDDIALLKLAVLCLQGAPEFLNHKQGKIYLERAAESGNAKAMYNLGCCYAKFPGTNFNNFAFSREKAVFYLKKAYDAGITQAKDKLSLLGE